MINNREARAFGTASGLDESVSIADIALYIARLPKENASRPRIAVITQVCFPSCPELPFSNPPFFFFFYSISFSNQGPSPTIVAYADGTIHTFPIPPLLPEQMVDFNGL